MELSVAQQRFEGDLNETQLLNGLRCQDPDAVRHLSECYLPSVWRFVCVRVGGDQHLAEDIVSETVLALIRAAAAPDGEIDNPVAWLRSVANRKVNDHYRAAARVKHLIDQVKQVAETADHDEPVSQHEREERRGAIRGVMNQLAESHRMALEWKYIDRLSVREIASRLDLTEKAVESLLFRARKEFRDRLERQTDEISPSGGASQSGRKSRREASSAPEASCEGDSTEDSHAEDSLEGDSLEGDSLEGDSLDNGPRIAELRSDDQRASLDADVIEHPVGAEHSIPAHQGE
jgi:RNA polymerase sigma factor (sigma-70 family)